MSPRLTAALMNWYSARLNARSAAIEYEKRCAVGHAAPASNPHPELSAAWKEEAEASRGLEQVLAQELLKTHDAFSAVMDLRDWWSAMKKRRDAERTTICAKCGALTHIGSFDPTLCGPCYNGTTIPPGGLRDESGVNSTSRAEGGEA